MFDVKLERVLCGHVMGIKEPPIVVPSHQMCPGHLCSNIRAVPDAGASEWKRGFITPSSRLTVQLLTLTMLRLQKFCPKHKKANIFENHLNPVMLVFIG